MTLTFDAPSLRERPFLRRTFASEAQSTFTHGMVMDLVVMVCIWCKHGDMFNEHLILPKECMPGAREDLSCV